MVKQTSGVKDLSSLVRYDDSCLAAIRHVQSILRVVRQRPNIPNIRSHSVLFVLLLQARVIVLLQSDCSAMTKVDNFSGAIELTL